MKETLLQRAHEQLTCHPDAYFYWHMPFLNMDVWQVWVDCPECGQNTILDLSEDEKNYIYEGGMN